MAAKKTATRTKKRAPAARRKKSPAAGDAPQRFASPRPLAHDGKKWVRGRVPASQAPARNESYEALPPPPASGQFHLDLAQVLPAAAMRAIQKAGKLVFHVDGDVGGIDGTGPQTAVADAMEEEIKSADPGEAAAFLYLVGDLVYFNGESDKYYRQFYLPYQFYPGPIFAVPGNHDGEMDPGTSNDFSLEGFMRNFCAAAPGPSPDRGDTDRDAMAQPYCYWTLDTPFATLIGLYSNVPAHGKIEDPQAAWFTAELKAAKAARAKGGRKAVVVCVHQPIFSQDAFHGGSAVMEKFFESAIARAGLAPDLILTGHVHNYQRFTWRTKGRSVTQLVVGAGGYNHLHAMAKGPDKEKPEAPLEIDAGLTLEQYSDQAWGYLRLEIGAGTITGTYRDVIAPHAAASPALRDSFTIDF
ncbi:MAG TPA: metallophosphoesterase [bacterium]|jgi:hypothetical protein|nr:metallophosphoesterase [bacterium]